MNFLLFNNEVIGVERSKKLHQKANQLYPKEYFNRLELKQGNATDLREYNDNSFDAAYMIHVGMNIQDKASLCKEAHRVLKEGGYFGIYDVMLTGDSNLKYPVPWAEIPENSFISSPEVYKIISFRLILLLELNVTEENSHWSILQNQ